MRLLYGPGLRWRRRMARHTDIHGRRDVQKQTRPGPPAAIFSGGSEPLRDARNDFVFVPDFYLNLSESSSTH
jgi:hypothetical protein